MKKKSFLVVFVLVIFFIVSGCAAKSPLIKAAASGDSSAVEKLVNEGANINEPDSNGYTPLMHAVWSRKTETVKVLINKGADVNAKDKNGYTPLLWAVSYGYSEIAKILLDKGANVNAKANDGSTPYSLAVQANSPELKLLMSKDADMKVEDRGHLLLWAVQASDIEFAKKLIKKGADINTKNPEGETVLDVALCSAQGDVVDEIIRSGVNLWAPKTGKARIFFVGRDLYDYINVTVGKQSKKLNSDWGHDKWVGVAFFDVDSGTHIIDANFDKYVSVKQPSIDVIAGKTYFFGVTQNIGQTAVLSRFIGRPLAEVATGNPFPITQLTESEGKQEIKKVLKSKEIK